VFLFLEFSLKSTKNKKGEVGRIPGAKKVGAHVKYEANFAQSAKITIFMGSYKFVQIGLDQGAGSSGSYLILIGKDLKFCVKLCP